MFALALPRAFQGTIGVFSISNMDSTLVQGRGGSSPRKARIDLNRFVLRVVGDGMNTFDHDCSENHEQL